MRHRLFGGRHPGVVAAEKRAREGRRRAAALSRVAPAGPEQDYNAFTSESLLHADACRVANLSRLAAVSFGHGLLIEALQEVLASCDELLIAEVSPY